MTGWRAVHGVMMGARLEGPYSSAKGYGFGVAAVSAGISLKLVQKWLGDAQLTTTAIYADASSAEERDITRRMWGRLPNSCWRDRIWDDEYLGRANSYAELVMTAVVLLSLKGGM